MAPRAPQMRRRLGVSPGGSTPSRTAAPAMVTMPAKRNSGYGRMALAGKKIVNTIVYTVSNSSGLASDQKKPRIEPR